MKKTVLIFLAFILIFTAGCQSKEVSSEKVTPNEANGITVYITKTGECYHKEGCSTLKKSKISKSLAYASKKYRPCQLCYPPIIEE